MGKWEANKRAGCWVACKNDDGRIGWVLLTDCDKQQAQSYALALNVVDAGVDMGDAVGFMDLFNAEGELIKVKTDVEFVKGLIKVRDFLTRIANAVEGDTTKEDV